MLRYPPLREPYATALRGVVAFVLERFDPCAIVAAGTIVRGSPSASSDLDVYVLHHAPERQRIQRLFGGVPAEIFVNPPAQVERYLEDEAREGRPITAHMLATGFVVLSRDDSLNRLREVSVSILARGPEVAERQLLERRYIAATLFEDALDIAASDPETSAALLTRAVEEVVRYAFWSARVWQPRPKDVLRRLGEIHQEAGEHVRAYYQAASIEAKLELASALFADYGVPTGFFEWESAREAT